ncbi:membrane-associated protein, putative, partial [Bodo saltans]
MGKQTRALLVVALVAIVLVILQALSGGSTQTPTALTAGDASALEPLIELPPPSNSTSWHVLPGEYRELFSTMVSVDVNVGNMYDLKQLSRQRTACESDVGRSANCTGAFEPMTAFVARCA